MSDFSKIKLPGESEALNVKDAVARQGLTSKIEDPNSKTSGQVLTWNGSTWVASDPTGASSQITFTLQESSFDNNVATIPVTGLTAESNGYLGVANSATQEQLNLAVTSQLRITGQQAGVLTLSRGEVSWGALTVPLVLTLI